MTIAQTGDRAEVLALSNERDVWLRRLLAAWREAYRTAELAHAAGYEQGFADGCMALKRAQHEAHGLAELDSRRWVLRGEQRTRETFSAPHRDDYLGGAA